MRKLLRVAAGLALTSGLAHAAAPAKPLTIYVVDVEGGNSVLFVAPGGQSLLIDTGNQGPIPSKRDAGRIMEAVKDAGLTQIDHLVITHWHADHFGGLAELAKQIPIKDFIDHGPNTQPGPAPDEFLTDVYPKVIADNHATHGVAKVGDRIALGDVRAEIVTSAGNVPAKPLPGAGRANPECAKFQPGMNNAEDPMSVGMVVAYGKFRTAHFGDITKNIEYKLMCPANLVGHVDLLLGLHHGQESSNSPVIIHALAPRVGIMNNGTRKGGEPGTMLSLHTSPGLEDVWQMHFSLLSGQEYTVPGMFIANDIDAPSGIMPVAAFTMPAPGTAGQVQPAPVHNGKAYWIKVTAMPDGTFTVSNPRNGFSKTYAAN